MQSNAKNSFFWLKQPMPLGKKSVSLEKGLLSFKPFISKSLDYDYAFVLGLIIGIFLIPVLINLGIASKMPYVYGLSIFGMPILAVLGLFIADVLVSKIAVLWQFAKFALVGLTNTVINFGVFNLFVWLTAITMGPAISLFAAVAFLTALVNSYIWNSHWSFKNKNSRSAQEFMQFFLVTLIGLLINSSTVYLVTSFNPMLHVSPKIWANIANLMATVLTAVWNFSGFKFFVFARKIK